MKKKNLFSSRLSIRRGPDPRPFPGLENRSRFYGPPRKWGRTNGGFPGNNSRSVGRPQLSCSKPTHHRCLRPYPSHNPTSARDDRESNGIYKLQHYTEFEILKPERTALLPPSFFRSRLSPPQRPVGQPSAATLAHPPRTTARLTRNGGPLPACRPGPHHVRANVKTTAMPS